MEFTHKRCQTVEVKIRLQAYLADARRQMQRMMFPAGITCVLSENVITAQSGSVIGVEVTLQTFPGLERDERAMMDMSVRIAEGLCRSLYVKDCLVTGPSETVLIRLDETSVTIEGGEDYEDEDGDELDPQRN